MEKFTPPRVEIVRFDAEDVIAASGLSVFSMHVNQMNDQYFTILNGDGGKAYDDWYSASSTHRFNSDDTMTTVRILSGDWYSASVADSSNSGHRGYTYIWYGSGSGVGNVTFNTHGKPWSYYLDNGITPPSGQ